jgi:hypothetical protein
MEVVHEYPDITVHLTLFNATIAEGVPQKLEHNDIKWITPAEISNYNFCPADEEILEKIIKEFYYKKHLEFAKTIIAVNDIPNESLDAHCQDLLNALPNEGKLYKYRSLQGKSFNYIYESLKEGYLWIPSADSLNDDFDSILFGDSLSYQKRVVDFLCRDKERFILQSIKKNGRSKWEQDEYLTVIPFELFLKCFDEKSSVLIDEYLIELIKAFFEDIDKRKNCLEHIKEFIKNCMLLPDARTFANDAYKYNRQLCDSLHVFSMSDSFDLDNMWGYYADSGTGFCVEYDFGKIMQLDDDCKKLLLNMYKVHYLANPKCFDVEAYTEIQFFENDDPSIYQRLTKSLIEQIVSKDITWEHENEWRIVLGNIQPKVQVDLMSGIVIDCRALNKTNGKKLIKLCKQKGWKIKVRCRSFFDGKHYFIDYNEYIKPQKQNE